MKSFKIEGLEPSDFIEEVKKYNLKFRCIDCIHFNKITYKCSFEYPNEELCDLNEYVNENNEFIFCKYFEMQ